MNKIKLMAVAFLAGSAFASAFADGAIYQITVPAGETNEFTAAQIEAVNSGDYGVLAKRGGGCLVGTNAISSFAGEIRIEEGAYWIKYNGELGTKDGATVVSNGAAIYVNTPAAALGENQLKFEYETFYFAGEGVSGEGAFCNRSPRDQYNFFNFANIFLTGDTLFTSKYRLDVRASAQVTSVWDLGGHKFTYRCVDSGVRTFSPTWGVITNMADMVVNHANLYFSDGRWFPEPGHTITLTNQAQMNLSFRYPSRFEGPSGVWRSGLDLSSSSIYTEPSSRPFSDCRSGTNIFNFAGPIHLSGTVKVGGAGKGTPFTFGGAVSGSGTLNVTTQRLQFASGENTYAGKIVVTGDAVTNSGIRLYKGANMPPCGGQAIAMSNAQLFLDENSTFNIGEVDFSGDGEIVGGLATGTVRSAMSKLVKTGDGTLMVDASLDVTGDAIIEGGTLKLGLPKIGNPGLGEGWFHCKRSGEPGTVYDFYNYQGATAWSGVGVGGCKIWRREGPAAVFSRAEWFYYKHVVYHGWVWNRTSENVNWSIAGSVGQHAHLYIDGTEVVGPSGQGINNGYVELTPGAHEITIAMYAGLMRHDNEDKAFPGPTIGAYSNEWWPWRNCGLGYDPQGRVETKPSDATTAKKNILDFFQPFKDPGDGSLFTIDNKTPEQIDQTIYHPVFSNLVMASSATLDLNGNTRFSVPKLTGFPHVTNGTLKVSGKWTLPAAELNAGGVMRVDGALDFADGALVSLDDMSQVIRRNFCNGQTVASATEGISGNPLFDSALAKNWRVLKSGDGKSLTLQYCGHFQVIIR